MRRVIGSLESDCESLLIDVQALIDNQPDLKPSKHRDALPKGFSVPGIELVESQSYGGLIM